MFPEVLLTWFVSSNIQLMCRIQLFVAERKLFPSTGWFVLHQRDWVLMALMTFDHIHFSRESIGITYSNVSLFLMLYFLFHMRISLLRIPKPYKALTFLLKEVAYFVGLASYFHYSEPSFANRLSCHKTSLYEA